jgi:capsular polysaccharide biosynthesis protein
MIAITNEAVPSREAAILVSPEVEPSPLLVRFTERVGAAYVAPAIAFQAPQPMLVAGRHLSVVTRAGGLIEPYTHIFPSFSWRQVFDGTTRLVRYDGGETLVVVGAGHANYFHWTTETLAAAILYRDLRPSDAVGLVVPPLLEPWRRQGLALFGLDETLVEVASDVALALDAGIVTDLIAPGRAAAPHPAMLRALFEAAPLPQAGRRDRRIYLARRDAAQRVMVNEQQLCTRLSERGFEIIEAGTLTVVEQQLVAREAAIIVAPHGAALTNIVFADDGDAGPCVVELFPETYMNPCFAKLCQAKRLSYTAVVNPAVTIDRHHHLSRWRSDLDVVLRAVADRD